MRLPRGWQQTSYAAKQRAGWRSELSGKPGRLETHHVRGREFNGTDDLQVLTRGEHIALHRAERIEKLPPDRREWVRYLANMR